MAKANQSILKEKRDSGPQTDDELWDWIKDNLGLKIPRVSVCPGHVSPFEVLADIYFERLDSVIVMANRGGSKTMMSAIIHLLNSLFRAGCWSITVGAQEEHARRAYDNLELLLRAHGKVQKGEDHPLVNKIIQRLTVFNNGSKVEILPGTPQAVNGPHSSKLHTDEVELMVPLVFSESRNITMTQYLPDPKDPSKQIEIKGQDWITSTRKSGGGPMQKLINEIFEAERQGFEPPYELRTWCIYEAAQNVPNCRVANPDLPEAEKCNCNKVVKGKWDDGEPRRLSDVCNGRLSKSEGFMPLKDVQKKFRDNSRPEWEAQLECSRPDTGGMVLKSWDRDKQGIKNYEPDPINGPIFQGVDYGGTNPHAVNWYQLLTVDVDVIGFDGNHKRLTEGSLVCFDEIYVAEIGNNELGDLVVQRETKWREKYPSFIVSKRFADVAAKAARLDWARRKNTPLPTVFYCTRDVKEHIKTCNSLLDDNKFFVDVVRCEMWTLEADAWHYPKRKPELVDDPDIPVDDFNHCMSNFRYVAENLKYLFRSKVDDGKVTPSSSNKAPTVGRGVRAGPARYQPISRT